MATPSGVTRRRNVGKLQTKTTSVSFAIADKLYVEEQARLRKCSFSLVIEEAVSMHRREMNRALTDVEREERAAKIQAGLEAAAKRRAGAATSTPPAEPVEL